MMNEGEREKQIFLCGHGGREFRAFWSRKNPSILVVQQWDRTSGPWKAGGHPVPLNKDGRANMLAILLEEAKSP